VELVCEGWVRESREKNGGTRHVELHVSVTSLPYSPPTACPKGWELMQPLWAAQWPPRAVYSCPGSLLRGGADQTNWAGT